MMDVHLCAIAVDLDLMQPSRTIRRAIAQSRVAPRDESEKRRALRAGNSSDGSALIPALQRHGTHADSNGSRGTEFPGADAV
jgi:hypothetical protein